MVGRGSDAHGILIVDKPVGPTSHDVVAVVRRAFSTRAVGHAGTLDPAASGVLVVAIGEGTKLLAHLTLDTKRYEATVRLGTSTSTLDAEGAIVDSQALPPALAHALAHGPLDLLESALERERQRREQTPPQFSAIKLKGRPAYERARRGEHVPLAPRPVQVHQLALMGAAADSVGLSLCVSKGYYVRALARDLGEALGVPAHLSSLCRVASGPFTLGESVDMRAAPDVLKASLQPLAPTARRILAAAELTEEGARRTWHGQTLTAAHFVSPPGRGLSAWFDPPGNLIALGRHGDDESYVSVRVFAYPTSSSAT
jgi:tRNA pseudouridine55 synthase